MIPQGGGGDLQPFVSAVLDSKPDVVWPLAGAEVLGFTSAMTAAGYTGTMANSAFYSPGLLTKYASIADHAERQPDPGVDSRHRVEQPVREADDGDYKAIGKSDSDITFGGLYGYMTADLMIATMKKVAPNFAQLVPTISKGFKYNPAKDADPLAWPAAYDSTGAVRFDREGRRSAVPDRNSVQLRRQEGRGALTRSAPRGGCLTWQGGRAAIHPSTLLIRPSVVRFPAPHPESRPGADNDRWNSSSATS